jgi:hypothetical protein
MTNSQRLRYKIDLVHEPLFEAAGRIWNHPRLGEMFTEFQFMMHSIIRATSPSMRAAAISAEGRAAEDPVCADLARYLFRHAEEERGHDEWMIDDLAVMGVPRDEVLRRMPSQAVAELVGAQYFWLHHYHPIAYVSYIAVLEGPPGVDFLESVVKRTGLPREAFSTFFNHAYLDPTHVAEFNEFLDGLALTDEHHEIMGMNAFHTVAALARVYHETADRLGDEAARVFGTKQAGASLSLR